MKPSNEDHDDTGTHYMMVWGSETAQNKWSGIALSNDGRLAHAYHASAKRTVDQILHNPWSMVSRRGSCKINKCNDSR